MGGEIPLWLFCANITTIRVVVSILLFHLYTLHNQSLDILLDLLLTPNSNQMAESDMLGSEERVMLGSEERVMVGRSSKPSGLEVNTFHLSCSSSVYEEGKSYVVFVLYEYLGRNDWMLNKVHCKTGYVVLIESKIIDQESKISTIQESEAHIKAFYQLFNCPIPKSMVGEGSAYIDGAKLVDMCTFNVAENGYSENYMSTITEVTKKYLGVIIKNWKEAGEKYKSLGHSRNYPVT